jgi:hypothetical protein
MRSTHRGLLTLAVCLAVWPGALPAETILGDASVRFEYPEEAAVIGGTGGMGFVSARIARGSDDIDLMLVIDVSASTRETAGDVNGDGRGAPKRRGVWNLLTQGLEPFRKQPRDDPDSALAAQLITAELLLAQVDPRKTRVGLIEFSGDVRRDTDDAAVVVPLTRDLARVQKGMEALAERGPHGRSNLTRGIECAVNELSAGEGAVSEARPGARRVAYLFTDGIPTLPLDASKRKNAQLAIEQAAKGYATAAVIIHTYHFGPADEGALELEIARASGGTSRSIDPSVIETRRIPAASLVNVKSVELENRTTGEHARQLEVGLDGSVFALVPMRPGVNQLAVVARFGDDHTPIETLRDVRFEESAPETLDVVERAARERLLAREQSTPADAGSPTQP